MKRGLEETFDWSEYADNDHGVPVLDCKQFEYMVRCFQDKEKRTESLVNFLMNRKQTHIPRQNKSNFFDLDRAWDRAVRFQIEDVLISMEGINVQMKHDEYSFDKKGCILIIQLGRQLNDLSDFFQRENRMKCGGYNRSSPANAWSEKNRKTIKGIVSCLWRMCSKTSLCLNDYISATRLSGTTYMASQFKVHTAAAIYRYFKAQNVIDPSMGWGDRLAGWFVANREQDGHYWGCDPNLSLHEGYKKQVEYYKARCSTDLQVSHVAIPSEECKWEGVDDGTIDLAFTSPPYADTERYAQDEYFENLQSWCRYKTTDAWTNDFLLQTIKNIIPKIRSGGYVAINMIDPEKNGKRSYVCDKLYNFCLEEGLSYEGFIGMRMKARPRPNNNNMKAIMVEPIWVFKKK